MTQLDEAITRYHRILESEPYRDLRWVKNLQDEMEARLAANFGVHAQFSTHRRDESLADRQAKTRARKHRSFRAIPFAERLIKRRELFARYPWSSVADGELDGGTTKLA